MADELHSFLDILADVAKQQEEEEKNKTQKSGDTESEEKTADRPRSTTATNEKSANDKNIKPAPQQEKDDPDFFNSAISNVKKNSRNSKKRNNSGEISIFDQISKNRKYRKKKHNTPLIICTNRHCWTQKNIITFYRDPRTKHKQHNKNDPESPDRSNFRQERKVNRP